jgi:RNA polymerase sigma-70 factor (ECF subfamily)
MQRTLHQQDLKIARKALAGSPRARQQFAERMVCVARILKVSNSRLGDPLDGEDLQDLIQETLATLWRRLPTYAGMAALETWAFRFCQFGIATFLRKRERQRAFSWAALETLEQPSPADYQHVHQALDRISPEGAQIVRLHHFEGRSFEQIGRDFGTPASTVKSHYHRAIARLRDLLTPDHREIGQ